MLLCLGHLAALKISKPKTQAVCLAGPLCMAGCVSGRASVHGRVEPRLELRANLSMEPQQLAASLLITFFWISPVLLLYWCYFNGTRAGAPQ